MKSVFDKEFAVYGKVIEGYDFAPLLRLVRETSEKPADHTIYVPSDPTIEALPVSQQVAERVFGGMPVQVGYCNGHNQQLNCLEYHRNSELNIPDDDMVFLVASLQKVQDGRLDTSEVEAFSAPAGTAVLLYETTLHYAPCSANEDGFKVGIVLPAGTNYPLKEGHEGWEDSLITAQNKWLIGHEEGGLDAGAHIGLVGKNLDIRE